MSNYAALMLVIELARQNLAPDDMPEEQKT